MSIRPSNVKKIYTIEGEGPIKNLCVLHIDIQTNTHVYTRTHTHIHTHTYTHTQTHTYTHTYTHVAHTAAGTEQKKPL